MFDIFDKVAEIKIKTSLVFRHVNRGAGLGMGAVHTLRHIKTRNTGVGGQREESCSFLQSSGNARIDVPELTSLYFIILFITLFRKLFVCSLICLFSK